MDSPCAVNLNNTVTLSKARLGDVTQLDSLRMDQICVR